MTFEKKVRERQVNNMRNKYVEKEDNRYFSFPFPVSNLFAVEIFLRICIVGEIQMFIMGNATAHRSFRRSLTALVAIMAMEIHDRLRGCHLGFYGRHR